jgi:hypothetical protein
MCRFAEGNSTQNSAKPTLGVWGLAPQKSIISIVTAVHLLSGSHNTQSFNDRQRNPKMGLEFCRCRDADLDRSGD